MKKEIVSRSTVASPVPGFPVATRAGHLLFLSGRMGLDPASGLPLSGYAELGRKPPPALGLMAPDSWEEIFVSQASRAYQDIETLLAEHGAKKTDLLFYSIYVREMRNFPVLARTRAAVFEGGVAPPSTASQVPGLLCPGAVLYFDPVALIPDAAHRKEVLTSAHVVQGPLSNYELASRAGGYTFYAGVVGAHPETGVIVYGADQLRDADWPHPDGGLAERLLLEPISAQTYTIYKLLRAMLEEHGGGLERVLRFNMYLRHMRELPETERIGRHFVPRAAPAGTVIGVESLARRDFFIEIEAITHAGSAPLRAVPRHDQVASWGRYADAVRGGDLVFLSGLMGYDARARRMTSRPSDLAADSARKVERAVARHGIRTHEELAAAVQAQSILDQMQAALSGCDSRLDALLKLTVYLRDMADFPLVREILASALGDDPPAITALAVADLPLREARVQIEAVAV
jgi:enamine deaminase RidA (YjgF/YER057c/UK114 family)